MSKLAVGSIEGLASEGYKITVPAGSKIVQAGAVLQVVSTTKTDTFSMTSTTFTDVTGLSASITPISTSSKVLVQYFMTAYSGSTSSTLYTRLMRDSTPIAIGETAGSRALVTTSAYTDLHPNQSGSILDSPNTTSSVTYKVQIAASAATYTMYVNRSTADTNSNDRARYVSTITVMEIAG